MLGQTRRIVESSNKKAYLPGDSCGIAAATIAPQGGEAVSISAFISHLDDTTRKRLDRMNQRLRQLELQMEAIEAEIAKASEE